MKEVFILIAVVFVMFVALRWYYKRTGKDVQ